MLCDNLNHDSCHTELTETVHLYGVHVTLGIQLLSITYVQPLRLTVFSYFQRNAMNKLCIPLIVALPFSTSILAQPVNHLDNNSLSEALRSTVAVNNNNAQVSRGSAKAYSHQSQKYNSLFASVLAIQGVKANIIIDANSKIDYARHKETSESNNSLFRGALAK